MNLIHGLTHHDTEKDPPERSSFLTASLCTFSNLRKDGTITVQCFYASTKKPPSKSHSWPQIMLRTAPNFSNSTNKVPAHILKHQTTASFAGFLLKRQLTTLLQPLAHCGEALTSRFVARSLEGGVFLCVTVCLTMDSTYAGISL